MDGGYPRKSLPIVNDYELDGVNRSISPISVEDHGHFGWQIVTKKGNVERLHPRHSAPASFLRLVFRML